MAFDRKGRGLPISNSTREITEQNWQAQANIFQCKALSEVRSVFQKKNPWKTISPIIAIESMYYNVKPNFDTSSGERIAKLSFISTEGLLIHESRVHWNIPIPGFQDSIFKSVMNFQVPLTFVSAKV